MSLALDFLSQSLFTLRFVAFFGASTSNSGSLGAFSILHIFDYAHAYAHLTRVRTQSPDALTARQVPIMEILLNLYPYSVTDKVQFHPYPVNRRRANLVHWITSLRRTLEF